MDQRLKYLSATNEPFVEAFAPVQEIFVLDRDPIVSSQRNDELTFLANAIAAGCSVQARPLSPEEAWNATLAVCVASTRPPENTREVNIAFGSRTTVRAKSTGGACADDTDRRDRTW